MIKKLAFIALMIHAICTTTTMELASDLNKDNENTLKTEYFKGTLPMPDWDPTQNKDAVLTIGGNSTNTTIDTAPREATCLSYYFRCVSGGCLVFGSLSDSARIGVKMGAVIALSLYKANIGGEAASTFALILSIVALALEGFTKDAVSAAEERYDIGVNLERREADETRIRKLSNNIV